MLNLNIVGKLIRAAWLSVAAAALAVSPVGAQELRGELKIGLVSFLSGPAAGPFGVPAQNAAKILIEGINAGTLPAPYDTPGMGGAKVVEVWLDESGKQKVADFRKLVLKDKVDLIIGYVSSGDCKAVAPIAEELEIMTVLYCGTSQIFEEVVPEPVWVFRASSHSTPDSVGAARYLTDEMGDIGAFAGINQNYAWGQSSWRFFSESMKVLQPDAETVSEQFPKIFAGEYGAEVSALLAARPEVVHSSFWGGDVEALILQGGGRGLFQRSRVILPVGEGSVHRMGAQIPDGTIIGGRGPNGAFAPESELNSWFRKAYFDRYDIPPAYPAYDMTYAVLAVKAAYDKAGGTDPEAARKAMEWLEFESPGGLVRMSIADGHQAVQESVYATYRFDKTTGSPKFENIRRYPPECVNPPNGMKSEDWIKAGFPGCQ